MQTLLLLFHHDEVHQSPRMMELVLDCIRVLQELQMAPSLHQKARDVLDQSAAARAQARMRRNEAHSEVRQE